MYHILQQQDPDVELLKVLAEGEKAGQSCIQKVNVWRKVSLDRVKVKCLI